MVNNQNPLFFAIQRWNNPVPDGNGNMQDMLLAAASNFLKANYGVDSLPKFFGDGALYCQKPVLANVTQFFTGPFTQAQSNMNGDYKLPQSEHMIIMGLQVMECVEAAATIDEGDWQPGISDNIAKNGNWQMIIDGQNVTPFLPATLFDPNQLSATVSGATNENRGIYWFNMPVVWLGQTSMTLSFYLNNGKVPTANYNLRFMPIGLRYYGNR